MELLKVIVQAVYIDKDEDGFPVELPSPTMTVTARDWPTFPQTLEAQRQAFQARQDGQPATGTGPAAPEAHPVPVSANGKNRKPATP